MSGLAQHLPFTPETYPEIQGPQKYLKGVGALRGYFAPPPLPYEVKK